MSNSTNTVIHFDEKDCIICLKLPAKSHTIYMTKVGCSVFYPTKFEHTKLIDMSFTAGASYWWH